MLMVLIMPALNSREESVWEPFIMRGGMYSYCLFPKDEVGLYEDRVKGSNRGEV